MAYAAALSLLKILKQLQQPDQFPCINYPEDQIKGVLDTVSFLKEFLQDNSSEQLETDIRDALYKVEDIIETNISFWVNSGSIMSLGLEDVVKETTLIREKAQKKYSDGSARGSKRPSLPTYHLSSVDGGAARKNIMVGRNDNLNSLKAQLMENSGAMKFIPIVGDRGVGKTLLAQVVYSDPEIASHFKTRAWVNLSLEHSKRDVILGVLRSMKRWGSGKHQERTEDVMADRLARILKSKRYLIVLDDICSVKAWDNLKEIFSDYHHSSRVVLTTRSAEVANSVGRNAPFQVSKLEDNEAWDLLQKIVFLNKSCPPEQEKVAKDVAQNCKGLPLAIVTIGRVLLETNPNDWRIAASSIGRCENYNQLIHEVISLSYKSLPQYVKGPLLYMGIFPRSDEIPVSKLINLWIAEGFLEATEQCGSLEDMGDKCLSKLFKRGIILVPEWSPGGRMRSCRVDGVYRDFIERKAEEEKFFHVINKYIDGFPEEENDRGRFCILKNIRFSSETSASLVRSLLFGGPQEQYPLWVHLDFKLLRVLDALKILFYRFPDEILKLVHLRYLAMSYNGNVPESICNLWNLQFLVIVQHLSTKYSGSPSPLPMEIWNLKELRHLQLMGRDLPNAFPAGEKDLENLLRLSDVGSNSCTPTILCRIRNLKKLGIRIESPALDAFENFNFLSDLHILHQLESLKYEVVHPDFRSQVLSSPRAFPATLRKLSLSGCGFKWWKMWVIAALPNLEVLKLRWYAFRGREWKPDRGGFPQLKFLLLEDLDIEQWIAGCDHFPFLTSLIIRHCYKLQEIPRGVGHIPTLKMIEVVDCSSSTEKSAQEIKMEQLSRAYIQVDYHSSRDD